MIIKSLNKCFKLLFIFTMALCLAVAPLQITQAYGDLIDDRSISNQIAPGTIQRSITRFTTDGWLKINVIEVDLNNPYIKVDVMQNSNGLQNLTNIKDLAVSQGAVAGINSDFFTWSKTGTSGGSSIGYPSGVLVKDGKVESTSTFFNGWGDSMATFAVDQFNNLTYGYWKSAMTLTAANGTTSTITWFNKHSSREFTDISAFNSAWGPQSIGAVSAYPDMVEVVIDGNKVTEIRQGKPAVNIPLSGYVLTSRKEGGDFLLNNLKVGDTIKIDITTAPDWTKVRMATSGGAILLKDGNVPVAFSYDTPAGRHPRSAVGSSQNGKKLFLVTVDGRQEGSIGMTLTELAWLMKELGAHNAINFDGGGSTTMAARPIGSTEISIVNAPSDGAPRKVASGIGIFSSAPQSELSGMVIETIDRNVFVNTSREFTLKGYDKFYNPITLDMSQIRWSMSGVSGIFKGNTFYPASIGEGKITAAVGNVTASLNISVLSDPVQYSTTEMNQTGTAGQPGGTSQVSVKGKNRNGFYALINPSDVKWPLNNPGYVDESNKATVLEKGDNGFRFTAAGFPYSPKNLLQDLFLRRFSSISNDSASLTALVGGGALNTTEILTGKKIVTDGKYSDFNYMDSLFIKLESSRGGLRASEPAQWKWFLNELENAKEENIFIFMDKSPFGFNDPLEKALFMDKLTQKRLDSGKNIWVFYLGEVNDVTMEEGIKYFSLAGYGAKEGITPENPERMKYIEVTVKGKEATWQIKPVIE